MIEQKPQSGYIFLAAFSLSLLLRMNFTNTPTWLDAFVSFWIAVFVTASVEIAIYFFADFVYDALVGIKEQVSPEPSVADQLFTEVQTQPRVMLDGHRLWVRGNMTRFNDSEVETMNRIISEAHEGVLEDGMPSYATPNMTAKLVQVGFINDIGHWTDAAKEFLYNQ